MNARGVPRQCCRCSLTGAEDQPPVAERVALVLALSGQVEAKLLWELVVSHEVLAWDYCDGRRYEFKMY